MKTLFRIIRNPLLLSVAVVGFSQAQQLSGLVTSGITNTNQSEILQHINVIYDKLQDINNKNSIQLQNILTTLTNIDTQLSQIKNKSIINTDNNFITTLAKSYYSAIGLEKLISDIDLQIPSECDNTALKCHQFKQNFVHLRSFLNERILKKPESFLSLESRVQIIHKVYDILLDGKRNLDFYLESKKKIGK